MDVEGTWLQTVDWHWP